MRAALQIQDRTGNTAIFLTRKRILTEEDEKGVAVDVYKVDQKWRHPPIVGQWWAMKNDDGKP